MLQTLGVPVWLRSYPLYLHRIMPAKEKAEAIVFYPPSQGLFGYNSNSMNIYINDTEHELPQDAAITAALDAIGMSSQKGIAIAINNNVVPRTEWHNTTLQANDKVTLIRATQGG